MQAGRKDMGQCRILRQLCCLMASEWLTFPDPNLLDSLDFHVGESAVIDTPPFHLGTRTPVFVALVIGHTLLVRLGPVHRLGKKVEPSVVQSRG